MRHLDTETGMLCIQMLQSNRYESGDINEIYGISCR